MIITPSSIHTRIWPAPTGTILAGRLEQEVCDNLRRLAKDSKGLSGLLLNGRTLGVLDHQSRGIAEDVRGAEADGAAESLSVDWDNLAPLEQARRIRFILQSVEYNGRTERVTLTLTDEAATNLES